MPLMKGGEYIADFLIKEKIPYVFGICGHGNVGLLDALYDRRDQINLISPRHEQAAGHMADAYFRVAHRPAATLASIGPGAANMLMSLANAYLDSSAMLAITANAPTSQMNRGAFQELYRHNQGEFWLSVRPYVKRSYQPSRADMLPIALRQGLALCTSGRPGPVNIDIPFDVFQEEAELEYEASNVERIQSRPGAAPDVVARVADLVLGAKRPLIYAGHGAALAEAGPELTAFAHALQIPVVNLPNGMGTLDMRDPLALGFIGRNGAYAANQAGRRCDVLLCLGARFDDRSASSWIQGYSWNIPPTKLIQVDIDDFEVGRNYPVEIGVVADAKVFLAQLHAEIMRRGQPDNSRHADWLADIKGWRGEWDAFVKTTHVQQDSPVPPHRIVEAVRRVLPDDGILVLDVGSHHNWFMQFWEARAPQRMLNAYGFGGMGFGVCGVLGAKLAAPDKPCVAVVGDGGFTMAPHILCTAVEYDIPVVWVVWNNFGWTSIRDIQTGMFQGREIGTLFYRDGERYNPDFAAIARASGVHGVTVTKATDFEGALRHAIGLNKPVLIDVHVDGDIRPPATGAWRLPPTPYREPAYGRRYLPGDPTRS